ncbi:hypothetical protein EMIT0194P_40409 [Pseudomonas serbica]
MSKCIVSPFTSVVWEGPFAGKPAPTVDLCRSHNHCRSGLAREGVISHNKYASLCINKRLPQYMADFQPSNPGSP